MSVFKNIDKLTQYIQYNYPTLEFGHLSVSNEIISHICSAVLGNKSNKTKYNLVQALNNANSALRKSLNGVNADKTNFHKKIENMGYSKNDFCIYNTNVLKSVCEKLRIQTNKTNLKRMFKKCHRSFAENEHCVIDNIASFQKENNLNDISVSVKRKLFLDDFPEKKNIYESSIHEHSLNVDDSIEHDSVKSNPALFSNFETDSNDFWELTNNKEIKVNQKLTIMPKLNSIVNIGELFKTENKFKSIDVCSTLEADLKALPKGSKNVFPENVRIFSTNNESKKVLCYKKCNFVEGIISLKDNEINKLVNNVEGKHTLVVSDESNDLLRKIFESINNSCVLTFKTKNTTAKGFMCYGICRHETCKQFKLIVEKKTNETGAQMKVLSNSNNYSHSGGLTTFLRGKQRERQRQMSKYCPPMSLRLKYILNTSPSKLKRGNLGNIRSDRVFYKVSHEMLSRDDQAIKDRDDMYLLKESCSEFIKYVSEPEQPDFETYLFSKDQVEVLKKIGSVTMHVDATGTVVRETTRDPSLFHKGKNKEKRLLYYAAVTTHNGKIIPVAEYLTTKQTASAITNWLIEFRKFYEKQCNTKLVVHVVSDFSGAILKAFAKAFNDCNVVVDYLNKCYDFMYEGQTFDCNVVISLCSCHRSLACLVTACVAPAFNISTVECLDLWFTAIATVLLSPYKTKSVNDAMVVLEAFSGNFTTSSLVDEILQRWTRTVLINNNHLYLKFKSY